MSGYNGLLRQLKLRRASGYSGQLLQSSSKLRETVAFADLTVTLRMIGLSFSAVLQQQEALYGADLTCSSASQLAFGRKPNWRRRTSLLTLTIINALKIKEYLNKTE